MKQDPDLPRPSVQLILVPVLYYAGAKLSLAFAVMPEVLVMLWIPNSILLATMFHYGWRRFTYFAGLIILAEIVADYHTFSLVEAALFGVINMLEVSLVYVLLRFWRFDPRFTRPADIAIFVAAGPAISAFLSACAAATHYSFFRGDSTNFGEFLRVWWFSDGLGLLILTPLVLSLWPPMPVVKEGSAELRWYDSVALVLGLTVIGIFAFSYQRVFHGVAIRSFLLIPPVLYAASRFSIRIATAVVAATAAVILYMAHNGQQPFGNVPIRETVTSVQEFIFILGTSSLAIAALLSQHRRNVHELEARVQERTAELKAANKELENLASTDALTGVLNRRALFDLVGREIARHNRHQRTLALILFDVDHFKEVNDHYGHATGDAVLRQIATACCNLIRNSDTLARYGGEEFVIVAPETDKASALQLAERIRVALRSIDFSAADHFLRLTASFGVATLRTDEKELEEIFRRADQALYAAKARGRDRVIAETSTCDLDKDRV